MVKSTLMDNERVLYLDILRIFSVFCMIVLHANLTGFRYFSPESFEWQVYNVFGSLVRICVPLFVMISGALFLDPNKEIPLTKLFSKYILRIVTAFLFWSVLYAIYNAFYFEGSTKESVVQFIKEVISGQFHMWFLFMIVGLYLIVPFLKKITANKKLTEYFLILAFIFALIIPLLMKWTALGSPIFETILGNANIAFVTKFPIYYVAGYYFSINQISCRNKLIIYILGIVSIIFTIFTNSYLSIQAGAGFEALYDYLYPNTALFTLAVFIFFRSFFEERQFSDKATRAVLLFSKCSFGIYLAHVFVLIFFNEIGFTTFIFNPIVSIPLVSISIFFASFLISFLLNKIPVIKRYIV